MIIIFTCQPWQFYFMQECENDPCIMLILSDEDTLTHAIELSDGIVPEAENPTTAIREWVQGIILDNCRNADLGVIQPVIAPNPTLVSILMYNRCS